MKILYSTFEIDLVDPLVYFENPKPGVSSTIPQKTVNVTAQKDPIAACASACLRERDCQAFSVSSGVTTSCTWGTSVAGKLTPNFQFTTYVKNSSAAISAAAASLPAQAGSDYTPVTAQSAFMEDGSMVANLTVPILTDNYPEMDESFSIQILKVGDLAREALFIYILLQIYSFLISIPHTELYLSS